LQLEQSAAEASDFLDKIEGAIGVLQEERKKEVLAGGRLNGGLAEIRDLENLAIVSDLHGDSKSLFQILSEINYERFLSNPMNKLIFLGDYVDRGSDSIGVMYSVCHLKSTYPDSVLLMRGNHEAPAEFPFPSHDFPYMIEERFGDGGKQIYQRLLSMFKLLTLVAVVKDKLLLVHGGLPTEDVDIESIAKAQENLARSRVLEELLWNDPRQVGETGWEKSRRGIGRHFGSTVSQRWLQATNTKAVVRGHEPCYGFRLDHDDAAMTLFSCREAYPKFKAAYLMLGSDQLACVSNARDLSRYVRFLESP
jgi:protein phosphatase